MSGFVALKIERRLSDQLARAMRAGSDLTLPMNEISDGMLDRVLNRFQAERSPAGVPWKKSQRAAETAGKTLQYQKYLYAALDRRSGAAFAEAGVKGGGPQETYAAIHQFGGTIRPKKKKALSFGGRLVSKVIMPARPYLGFGDDDRADIETILRDHLRAAFDEGARV